MTEEELIELATHLIERAAPAGGIPEIECLDGFLCGIVTSPELVEPSEWMPLVWGADHVFTSEAEAQRLTATLLGYYNWVVYRLAFAADDENSEPPPAVFVHGVTLVDEAEEGEGDGDAAPPVGSLWAVGFGLAYQLRSEAWEARANEWPLVADLLAYTDSLLPQGYCEQDDGADDQQSGDAKPAGAADSIAETAEQPHGDRADDAEEAPSAEDRKDVVLALGEMLRWLYVLNRERALARRTVRRAGPKIGRNDPCPCGSGRKYKRCHGA
jgi:uncharacterized protein